MTIYGPKQIVECSDHTERVGRWNYTRQDSGGAVAAGYCVGWTVPTEEEVRVIFGGSADRAALYVAERLPWAAKYHEDGHVSAEEAAACWADYLADQRTRLDVRQEDHLERCAICREFTDGLALVDGGTRRFVLCDEHRTREVVRGLLGRREAKL